MFDERTMARYIHQARPLRAWQAPALRAIIEAEDRGIYSAVMGAGKSYVIAVLAAGWRGPVTVVVPSVQLVNQTWGDMLATNIKAGRWFGGGRTSARVIVACADSLAALPARNGELVIVDECHRLHRALIPRLTNAARSVGFSATPYRDGGKGLQWWTHQIGAYLAADALEDGALVPPRVVMADRDADLDEWCIDRIRETEGPGVVSADSIADADEFAATLTEAGIPSASIHSAVHPGRAATILSQLERGELKAVTHVRMLVEGVNLPWLRWICFRREQKSRVEFAQMAGRGLRTHPGKTECVMIDPHQLFLAHQLGGVAEILEAAEGPPPPAKRAEKVIDPVTGELIDWSEIDASERRRVKALARSWSYIAQAALALRIAGHLKPEGIDRGAEATGPMLLQLRRHTPFARAVISLGGRIDGLRGQEARHAHAIALAFIRLATRAEAGAVVRRGPTVDAIGLLLYAVRPPKPEVLAAIHAAGIEPER